MTSSPDRSNRQAPLPRRLAALVYDTIAVFTVLYFAAFVPVIAAGGALAPGNPLFSAYLVAVAFSYFWACWTRGRTLGMQAWKLRIEMYDGSRPNLRACAVRFVGAMLSAVVLGLGYLAALGDHERRTWHDRLSGTRLVMQTSGEPPNKP